MGRRARSLRIVAVVAAGAVLALVGSGPPASADPLPRAQAKAQAKDRAAAAVTADGSLTVTTASPTIGSDLTLHYETDAAQVTALNWVAIYDDPANGPINQVYSGHPSTTYQYVDTASGDVTFDTSGLSAGTKIAYFLSDDGYQWLARPVAFTLLAAGAPTPDGTLTLTSADATVGDQVTFAYSTGTQDVDPLNWVGLYDDPADGPIDQTVVGSSTDYQYVADASGQVSFDTAGLTPGAKVAYFLAKDGYGWLARPVSFFLAPSATGGPSADGVLTLTSTNLVVGEPLTFHYETDTPLDLNWVGLYDNPADGPTDQTFHAGSTVWSYVSGTSGDVTFDSSALSVGTHSAYFLYDDGYTWLAQPVTFTLAAAPPPVVPHFVADDFSAGYVHTGAAVRQPLQGLWVDPKATSTTFAKTSGASWLSVSADGVVTGTAPATVPSHPALVTVQATDDAGRTASVTVEFTVYRTAAPPALKTATWNLWDAGSHVDDAQEKELATILTNGLDVVGVQESGGTAARALATALGWSSYQSDGDLGIISRYPLTAVTAPTAARPAAGATAQVGGRAVRVWVTHLDEAGYGPYAVCLDGRTAAQVTAAEKATTRYAQAKAVAAAMVSDLRQATKTPVVLLGDLASPSHKDWTKRTSPQHCGAGPVRWPVTQVFEAAGLKDSYRVAHNTPKSAPGITWSPVLAQHPGGSAAEPQDRIDYVDFAGPLGVTESHTLVTGFPAPEPDVGANSWTSDHAAVVTTLSFR